MIRSFLRWIYNKLPFKMECFCLLRRLWRPPHSVYKHLHFTGTFSVPLEGRGFLLNHHGYEVENAIFWTGLKGDWEGVSMSLWLELCRKSQVILDVGANTGVYSLAAKAVNPDAKVFAFEPVARVFDKLKENCAVNRYDIRCIRQAVSNYDGKAKIYDPMTDHVYSVTVNRKTTPADFPAVEVEVDTVALATFLRSLEGMPRLDLMKLDVETHEPEALEGMGDFLDKLRPSILIEILTLEIARKVERLVSGMEYLFFNIDELRAPRRQEHLSASEHYNFLLCAADKAKQLRLI